MWPFTERASPPPASADDVIHAVLESIKRAPSDWRLGTVNWAYLLSHRHSRLELHPDGSLVSGLDVILRAERLKAAFSGHPEVVRVRRQEDEARAAKFGRVVADLGGVPF